MIGEWVRKQCLSWPGVTESVQWGDHLVFKIGGKIFVITSLERDPDANVLSLKCSVEDFETLSETPGFIPAPYLARAKWVAMQHEDAMTRKDLLPLLRKAYELVRDKLPKKVRVELELEA